MPKITKRAVDSAAPKSDKRYTVWDSQIPGFGLLVLPSGRKSYIFQYRNIHGQSRRATIGRHGFYTPDEARQIADDMAKSVKHGRDPLAEKEAAKEAPTVNELIDDYLKSPAFNDKAESTKATDRGRIERHIRPLLGRKHVEALTRGDIERAFAAIRDGKTAANVKTGFRGLARVRGGEGTAKKAIRL